MGCGCGLSFCLPRPRGCLSFASPNPGFPELSATAPRAGCQITHSLLRGERGQERSGGWGTAAQDKTPVGRLGGVVDPLPRSPGPPRFRGFRLPQEARLLDGTHPSVRNWTWVWLLLEAEGRGLWDPRTWKRHKGGQVGVRHRSGDPSLHAQPSISDHCWEGGGCWFHPPRASWVRRGGPSLEERGSHWFQDLELQFSHRAEVPQEKLSQEEGRRWKGKGNA